MSTGEAQELQPLFEAIRAACSAGSWSRGVELARADAVSGEVDDGSEMLACPLPPRTNADLHPAIDEARGLRPAYDRAIEKFGNHAGTGRVISADGIEDALSALRRVATGTAWKEAGIPGIPARVAQDIRGYYETAALGLSDHIPSAWSGTRWFFDATEGGKLLLAARSAMRDSGVKQPIWFYMAPGDR